MKREPLIITGMHRSGTSLVASLFHDAGVNLGPEYSPADLHNKRGYFEDIAFNRFQRKVLNAASPPGAKGHTDWGWTEEGEAEVPVFGDQRAEAEALIKERKAAGGRWGWKDPRTTCLLDAWSDVLGPKTRYLMVYRFPWDCADSVHRLMAEVFLRHPDFPYRIWTAYNRRLLDFYLRHQDQCLLVNSLAVVQDRAAFHRMVKKQTGVSLGDHDLSFAARGGDDPIINQVAIAFPECLDLLEKLEAAADLSCTTSWTRPPRKAPEPASKPRVSVIIPFYNDRGLLLETLASVERHAEVPVDVLIGDDASTDAVGLQILDRLKAAGYSVHRFEHSGCGGTRNRLIKLARGACLLPLDCDNRIHADFLKAALRVMDEQEQVGVVYGWYSELGSTQRTRKIPGFDFGRLLAGNYIDACALIRSKVFDACGGYDESLETFEDWDLWITAAENGWVFHSLEQLTFEYRVRPGSLVSTMQDPDVRSDIFNHVVGKHLETYRTHLQAVVLGGAEQIGSLWQKEANLWRAYCDLKAELDNLHEEQARSNGKGRTSNP